MHTTYSLSIHLWIDPPYFFFLIKELAYAYTTKKVKVQKDVTWKLSLPPASALAFCSQEVMCCTRWSVPHPFFGRKLLCMYPFILTVCVMSHEMGAPSFLVFSHPRLGNGLFVANCYWKEYRLYTSWCGFVWRINSSKLNCWIKRYMLFYLDINKWTSFKLDLYFWDLECLFAMFSPIPY